MYPIKVGMNGNRRPSQISPSRLLDGGGRMWGHTLNGEVVLTHRF